MLLGAAGGAVFLLVQCLAGMALTFAAEKMNVDPKGPCRNMVYT